MVCRVVTVAAIAYAAVHVYESKHVKPVVAHVLPPCQVADLSVTPEEYQAFAKMAQVQMDATYEHEMQDYARSIDNQIQAQNKYFAALTELAKKDYKLGVIKGGTQSADTWHAYGHQDIKGI